MGQGRKAPMRLTQFTDFGLRALMRMASAPERAFSTAELADEFGISRNHLTKAIAALSAAGFVETRRGIGGGARLAAAPETLRLGRIVAVLESGSALVECFRADSGACTLNPECRLRGILGSAKGAFIESLDRYTLADCALMPLGEYA